jgi:hypothetical protein
MDTEHISVNPTFLPGVFKSLSDLPFILWKFASLKKKMMPKNKGQSDCASLKWLRDNVRGAEKWHVFRESWEAWWEN